MKKSLFYLLLLLCFSPKAIAQNGVINLMTQHDKLQKTGKIEESKKQISVTAPKYGTYGFRFIGNYDFCNYKNLRVTIENHHKTRPLYLIVELMNKDTTFREPTSGLLNRKYTISAGERRTIDFAFLPTIPHKEVANEFRLMRSNPYSLLTQSYCYDIDLSNVKFVKIAGIKMEKDQQFTITRAEVLPGAIEQLPEPMTWDKDKFFPFIDKYGQFKHKDWPGKTFSDEDLKKDAIIEKADLDAHPGPEKWSKYGGYMGGKKYQATGHFRVEKIDGKWWMIDPEGYLFWSNGVVRVTTSSAITPLEGKNLADRSSYFENLPKEDSEFNQFYYTHDALLKPYYTARNITRTYDFSSANCYRKYGPNYKQIFAELAHKRLRSWGLNTIANSSDKDICLMDKTPYTDRFEVVSKPIEGTTGWWPFMDPFDDSFNQSINRQFELRKNEVEDPWCIGLFVDNEIKWNDVTYLAEMTLKAPKDQPCKQVMVNWLEQKYSSIQSLNNAWDSNFKSWNDILTSTQGVKLSKKNKNDLQAFNRQIIDKYFSNIRNAFKKYAPGVLYMGCRFAGSANADVISIASKYCDIMSYNSYQYTLDSLKMEGIDLPIMIGEYHFGALDRGLFHASLIDVESQKGRQKAVEHYINSALRNPFIIGVHWHQFSDQATTGRFDGESFQVGLTDCCDKPYNETIKGFRNASYKLYQTRLKAK